MLVLHTHFLTMDKAFEKEYTINVQRLQNGHQEERFAVKNEFFSHFEHAPLTECEVEAVLSIDKYESHLDVIFRLSGKVGLECDRCLEIFSCPITAEERVIYSFEKEMEFADVDEVIYLNRKEIHFSIVQELYDFICIAIPFRKVHEDVGEECNPEIMKLFVSDEDLLQNEEEEEEVLDPRWAKLKGLKRDDE